MQDRYETNDLGIRALAEGERIVKRSSVSINGERYGGVCLGGLDGTKIHVSVIDRYGLTYEAQDRGSRRILGTIKCIVRAKLRG
jgi:hypothetical protein